MPTESIYISLLCGLLGGAEPETTHFFDVYGYARPRYIRVDCETPTHVIEIGLDERVSARDSVHQAALAASFTGKAPWVILIDTDGAEGRFELEMRHVTRLLGVAYTLCSAGFLESWSATAGLRGARAPGVSDLPANATAASRCPIGRVIDADRDVPLPTN
jgi:hypothetical protein